MCFPRRIARRLTNSSQSSRVKVVIPVQHTGAVQATIHRSYQDALDGEQRRVIFYGVSATQALIASVVSSRCR
eukprot:8103948-Pyramimonas_sp.AAC.1